MTVISLISAYGVCAFVKRGFPAYMFMRTAFAFFDYGEPRAYFFMDYLAVMVLFAFLGMLIAQGLSAATHPRRGQPDLPIVDENKI